MPEKRNGSLTGMAAKIRLDKRLVQLNLFASRQQAQAAVMAGVVAVDGVVETKAGKLISEDARIEILGKDNPYVSRGGLKLEKALRVFRVDVSGKLALDIGASTGGFTDCLLQHGARTVYAVDVGYGQLHWKLRNDPRVVNLERSNIRTLPRERVPEQVDVCTVDVSFISAIKVMQAATSFLKGGADVILLIKPQFEAGPERVGKGGIVRDPEVHRDVLRDTLLGLYRLCILPLGIDYSPIRGSRGNIEFLFHGRYDSDRAVMDPDVVGEHGEDHDSYHILENWDEYIDKVVAAAHHAGHMGRE